MTHFTAGMKRPGAPNCPVSEKKDNPTVYELLGVTIFASTKEIERILNEKLRTHAKRAKEIHQMGKMFTDPYIREWYGVLTDFDELEIYRHLPTSMGTITQPEQRHLQIALQEFKNKAGEMCGRLVRKDATRLGCALEDLYLGSEINMSIKRYVACACNNGFVDRKCDCIVKGRCQRCKGKGKHSVACPRCEGRGNVEERIQVPLKMPAGAQEGHTVVLPRAGNKLQRYRDADDLFIKLEANEHKVFRRQGFDLHMTKTLTVSELLLGQKFVITTLDEEKKIVVNTKGKCIQPGSTMVIKGKGMPVTPTTRKRFGDVIIHFRIEFPKSMSHLEPDEMSELKTLLPEPGYPTAAPEGFDGDRAKLQEHRHSSSAKLAHPVFDERFVSKQRLMPRVLPQEIFNLYKDDKKKVMTNETTGH